MKFTDDYHAKYKIWARERRVHPLPKLTGLPRFAPQKFSSWAAFNAWKKSYLERIARNGGVQWTK